jgi:transposase, IS5 family
MQLGFGDGWISPKLGQNAMLERLSAEVKWYRFEKVLNRLKPEGAGRPPFEPLLMLKALLLQQWWELSDADLEEAINDRVSFRKFLGLSLEDASPDHTTLCRFRNRLIEEGLSEKLFSEFARQLETRGLILKRGTMVDASLVETPFRPPSEDGEREAVDEDAALTARKGKQGTHYGYKMHAGVDQQSRLIRRIKLTPANVNDTVIGDDLVCGDERGLCRQRLRESGATAWAQKPRHQAEDHAQDLGRWTASDQMAEASQRFDCALPCRGRRRLRNPQAMVRL